MGHSLAQIMTFGGEKMVLVPALQGHLRVTGQLSKHCLRLDSVKGMRFPGFLVPGTQFT